MTQEYFEKMEKLHNIALNIFKAKNADYGSVYEKYGVIGVLIRISDKISRLETITKNKQIMVKDENLRDTLVDLNNYSSIGLMLLDRYEKRI